MTEEEIKEMYAHIEALAPNKGDIIEINILACINTLDDW